MHKKHLIFLKTSRDLPVSAGRCEPEAMFRMEIDGQNGTIVGGAEHFIRTIRLPLVPDSDTS